MGLFFNSRVRRDPSKLTRHLENLSRAFPLWIGDEERFVIVNQVQLPPGYGQHDTSVLIEIPRDYPVSPPGVGSSYAYVPSSLRFRGSVLKDVHPDREPNFSTPGFGPWAWWCYQWIRWDPHRDNLITFMEMIRANMTDPKLD